MLDEIKDKLANILASVTDEDKEKYTLIKNILEEPEWFSKIDADTCISILIDLGYSLEEAKEVYMKLKGIEV